MTDDRVALYLLYDDACDLCVNDQLSIQYTLFRVQQASEVKVGIYALDGRRVWQAQPKAQAAGRHTARAGTVGMGPDSWSALASIWCGWK